MIEYEFKLMLTKKEYDCIKNVYGFGAETIRQVNYYYDTNGFDMNKKGTTCRIRQIGDYLCATKKNHSMLINGKSEEMSSPVHSIPDIMDFWGFTLRLQGSLVTERTNLKVNTDLMVTVDKNTYLGVEDYELEIEYDEENFILAECMLRHISEAMYFSGAVNSLEEFNLRLGKGKNKSARFFDRKKEVAL